jgi:hypothetical protein
MDKWISVKDEQPPKDTDIYIHTEHGGTTVAYWNNEYNKFAIEVMSSEFIEVIGEITHWMPLPKPPKD